MFLEGDRSKAILLVDDEVILLMALKQELKAELGPSYRYEAARSGEQGIEVIKDLGAEGIRVLIVISDWLMPGMRGDEFLELVHRDYPTIKTIMLSGMADPGTVERIMSSGILDAYFSKPWNAKRLAERCRQLLAECA